ESVARAGGNPERALQILRANKDMMLNDPESPAYQNEALYNEILSILQSMTGGGSSWLTLWTGYSAPQPKRNSHLYSLSPLWTACSALSLLFPPLPLWYSSRSEWVSAHRNGHLPRSERLLAGSSISSAAANTCRPMLWRPLRRRAALRRTCSKRQGRVLPAKRRATMLIWLKRPSPTLLSGGSSPLCSCSIFC